MFDFPKIKIAKNKIIHKPFTFGSGILTLIH
jgi:hypothetical protein